MYLRICTYTYAYVRVFKPVWLCMCVHVFVSMHTCEYVYVRMSTYMYACVRVCTQVYITYISACVYTHAYVYVRLFASMYALVHVFINVRIRVYTHVSVYLRMQAAYTCTCLRLWTHGTCMYACVCHVRMCTVFSSIGDAYAIMHPTCSIEIHHISS